MRVVDFFCGAGGFSEGFRQQGFEVIQGIDFWQPAVETHNLNHNLDDSAKNVLDFWSDNAADISEIDQVRNTEFIIGSPSCVSFSMSNKSGKGDKTLGIKLIEAYLRFIAVKKHQTDSILLGWYMENVPQSKNFIKSEYTFADLSLSKWSKTIGKKTSDIALKVDGDVLNAGDYGAPQGRKRFIAGEWTKTGEFIAPKVTHYVHVSSAEVRNKLPKPNISNSLSCIDPNYPALQVKKGELTDHFYDTGLYSIEWEKAEHLKTNHPFMGKMSFPENEIKTCRTVMATRSASTRESLIYKSEYNRKGNGEYRLPTIREISSLMGFPCVYQFVGTEGVKWKQIGNSVCPHMSAALAKALRSKMNLPEISLDEVDFSTLKKNYAKIVDLNTFEKKILNLPRRRKVDARFRRHPVKAGNMTVDFLNYHPDSADKVANAWYVSAFFGTGNAHGMKVLDIKELDVIESELEKSLSDFQLFKKEVQKSILTKINLQKVYEEDLMLTEKHNPIMLVKQLAQTIDLYDTQKLSVESKGVFPKEIVPVSQMMAAYGLLKLIQHN